MWSLLELLIGPINEASHLQHPIKILWYVFCHVKHLLGFAPKFCSACEIHHKARKSFILHVRHKKRLVATSSPGLIDSCCLSESNKIISCLTLNAIIDQILKHWIKIKQVWLWPQKAPGLRGQELCVLLLFLPFPVLLFFVLFWSCILYDSLVHCYIIRNPDFKIFSTDR